MVIVGLLACFRASDEAVEDAAPAPAPAPSPAHLLQGTSVAKIAEQHFAAILAASGESVAGGPEAWRVAGATAEASAAAAASSSWASQGGAPLPPPVIDGLTPKPADDLPGLLAHRRGDETLWLGPGVTFATDAPNDLPRLLDWYGAPMTNLDPDGVAWLAAKWLDVELVTEADGVGAPPLGLRSSGEDGISASFEFWVKGPQGPHVLQLEVPPNGPAFWTSGAAP